MMYPSDPLDLTLEQLLGTEALVNCGDADLHGGGSYFQEEYWSRDFPKHLQNKSIPIHVKEFWVVITSAWLWGERWRGKLVYIFCDNDAVVEVLQKEKPKDPKMQELLQEFLYITCTRNFTPIFRKIGSKENRIADFISRNHDPEDTKKFLEKEGYKSLTLVEVPDNLFTLRANW